jgi:hypothetical protein
MIFRKVTGIFLTFLLLVSNLGLAFNVHYCDDEIESITLSTAPFSQKVVDECCGVVEKDSKCCNDKVIKADIKADQILAKTLSFDANFITAFNEWKPLAFTTNYNFKKRDTHTYFCDANAPPLYLLYSQYTFYA